MTRTPPSASSDHVDRVAVAGQRLVDRVVHDLPDQVVQATLAGRADVHTGTLADRLEAFETVIDRAPYSCFFGAATLGHFLVPAAAAPGAGSAGGGTTAGTGHARTTTRGRADHRWNRARRSPRSDPRIVIGWKTAERRDRGRPGPSHEASPGLSRSTRRSRMAEGPAPLRVPQSAVAPRSPDDDSPYTARSALKRAVADDPRCRGPVSRPAAAAAGPSLRRASRPTVRADSSAAARRA